MGIILKHTFRNIFKKWGRTLLLTFCIFVCALAAICCLDVTSSVKRIFINSMTNYIGSTDIMCQTAEPISEEVFDSLPENVYLEMSYYSHRLFRREPKLYSYVIENSVAVYGFDFEKAYSMKLITEPVELNENEMAVTKDIAEVYGYCVGDTFSIPDETGNNVDYTVKQIVKPEGILTPFSCILSPEGIKRVSEQNGYRQIVIDILDNDRIEEAAKMLEEAEPAAMVNTLADNKELDELIDNLTKTFTLIFAICFLVVIIINITVSERIMSERLPMVGTLRSLGVSARLTTMILLLENILYALMGAVPAVVAYSLLREPVFNSIMTMEGAPPTDLGSVAVSSYVIVIVGAVLIECLCTMKECVKAGRMAIRDVIFRGNDSDYRHSMSKTVVGIILAALSAAMFILKKHFIAGVIGCAAGITSVYLLFPYVTVLLMKLAGRLFDKLNLPIAHIASTEVASKKSTIASTSLIAAAASITVIMLTYANSNNAIYKHYPYECDIVLQGCCDEGFMFSYLDNIEGVAVRENVYEMEYLECSFNGDKVKSVTIIGADGASMNKIADGMPDSLGDSEVLMDKAFAKRLGLEIGDEIEFCYDPDGFVPVDMKFTLTGWCNTVYRSHNGQGIIMSKKNYAALFHDCPRAILVNTDGRAAEDVMNDIIDYSADLIDEVQLIDDYNRELDEGRRREVMTMKLVGFFGIFLTLIGVVSNQLIGFEARRRENAVLLSTSMQKRHLKRMLLIETALSSAVSLLFAIPFGVWFMGMIENAIAQLDMAIPIVYNFGELVGVMAGLTAVFSMTVLFPYNALRKMKLADQLKYE